MNAMLRIGDVERSRVVEDLRAHAAAGRLSLDEFSQRSGQAYAARTRGELDEVVADLPCATAEAESESPRTFLWVLGVAALGVLFLVGFAGLAQLLS